MAAAGQRSLFYTRYGEDCDTAAPGMLLVCDDGKREEAGLAIIRQTMWQRRQLLGSRAIDRRERPVRYVRTPIRLAAHYGHAYLTTPATLARDVAAIEGEALIRRLRGSAPAESGGTSGDFTAGGADGAAPCRFFVNPATDLLKYVCLFAAAKSHRALVENPEIPYLYPMRYAAMTSLRDRCFLRMHADVLEMGEVRIYVLPEPRDAGSGADAEGA